MNRLELSYQGHPTTFFCKICWKEQILPRNLSNLGKASLFPYPVFYLLRSSSASMKIRNRGDLLTASEYWEFFLVVRGTHTIHFPPRKFVAPDLLWSPQRLFRWARLTNPAVGSGAKPNSTNINRLKRTATFGTVLRSKKVKRTNMLQYQTLQKKKRRKWFMFVT